MLLNQLSLAAQSSANTETRRFYDDLASNNCRKHAFSPSWLHGSFAKNNDGKLLCHKVGSDAAG